MLNCCWVVGWLIDVFMVWCLRFVLWFLMVVALCGYGLFAVLFCALDDLFGLLVCCCLVYLCCMVGLCLWWCGLFVCVAVALGFVLQCMICVLVDYYGWLGSRVYCGFGAFLLDCVGCYGLVLVLLVWRFGLLLWDCAICWLWLLMLSVGLVSGFVFWLLWFWFCGLRWFVVWLLLVVVGLMCLVFIGLGVCVGRCAYVWFSGCGVCGVSCLCVVCLVWFGLFYSWVAWVGFAVAACGICYRRVLLV